jgi:glycosyltransferase involved in cell wall biosynthesis
MNNKVTVIIPYKTDRGWLKDAIVSVPMNVQLIVSQGKGNWPQNFNKALSQATGDFIKYLHEDDMLTVNCIEDSLKTFESSGCDFIHGNAIELENGTYYKLYKPMILIPTFDNLLKTNSIHSATTMYRRWVFEKLGTFSEDNRYYSFEEFEFNLRLLKGGLKIGYCNQSLAFYRRHPRQIIRTVDKQKRKENRQELINMYK